MRKLIVTENITVDGVIDASGGWFKPAEDGADTGDLVEVIGEQSAAADAFLVGRVTFVEMRSAHRRGHRAQGAAGEGHRDHR